jgi:hypothetical protein
MITVAEIARRNSTFWAAQKELRDRRMRDPRLATEALKRLQQEAMRGTPVYSRVTLESALQDADAYREQVLADQSPAPTATTRSRVLAETGRKGGSTPKTRDPLQLALRQLVIEKPTITEAQLRRELERRAGPGNAFEFDGLDLIYEHPSGRMKTVPVRALKDRLSRAKKAIRSR